MLLNRTQRSEARVSQQSGQSVCEKHQARGLKKGLIFRGPTVTWPLPKAVELCQQPGQQDGRPKRPRHGRRQSLLAGLRARLQREDNTDKDTAPTKRTWKTSGGAARDVLPSEKMGGPLLRPKVSPNLGPTGGPAPARWEPKEGQKAAWRGWQRKSRTCAQEGPALSTEVQSNRQQKRKLPTRRPQECGKTRAGPIAPGSATGKKLAQRFDGLMQILNYLARQGGP